MTDKGPGGRDRPGDGGRKRKNESHEQIGRLLGQVYNDVENEDVPDSLLEILNRIPDTGSNKERS